MGVKLFVFPSVVFCFHIIQLIACICSYFLIQVAHSLSFAFHQLLGTLPIEAQIQLIFLCWLVGRLERTCSCDSSARQFLVYVPIHFPFFFWFISTCSPIHGVLFSTYFGFVLIVPLSCPLSVYEPFLSVVVYACTVLCICFGSLLFYVCFG